MVCLCTFLHAKSRFLYEKATPKAFLSVGLQLSLSFLLNITVEHYDALLHGLLSHPLTMKEW